MKFARLSITGILLISLLSSVAAETKTTEDNGEEDSTEEILKDTKGDLPILPPLILLDFTNGTNTSSVDEKSKRTVEEALGYGFQSNNLFNGRKYNYYYPSGKSGTTVSIEESISPFVPRTIIERVKPITEKPDAKVQNTMYRGQQFAAQQPTFGQRMNIQSSTSGTIDSYQRITTTSKPPAVNNQRPSYLTSTLAPPYNEFYTQKPLFQPNPSPSSSYTAQKTSYGPQATNNQGPIHPSSTLAPPLQSAFNRYMSQKLATSSSNLDVSEQYFHPIKALPSTPRPSYSNDHLSQPTSPLSEYPKYSVENGIKYEHRIVWKYPDGTVSNDPPMSYINSYSEFSPPVRTSFVHSEDPNKDVQYNNPTMRYQGPIQFPIDSEVNYQKRPPSPFVKPAASQLISQNQQLRNSNNQNQEPKNYRYFQRLTSKYTVPKLPVETANAEYLPPESGDSKGESGIFTSGGQLTANALSKYSIDGQKLLSKVLSPPKESYDSDDSESYTSSHYANLLNYNPSISQYIKNPASILNAQPTFIQAGNSLIPVIILRIDGAPPVQQKQTPNINLKALLQQYISQYAHSMSDFSRETNYEFGNDDSNAEQDPHYELKKLTDSLKQYSSQQSSQAKQNAASNVKDSYGNVVSSTEYRTLPQTTNNPVEESSYKKPQKVKNVQIIEDPRFQNLKDNN